MKQISIADLNPGMVAAGNIVSDGTVIVPKGIVFTENIIARLENYYIYYVYVEDYGADELSRPFITAQTQYGIPMPSDGDYHFSDAFKRCSEHYRSVLTGSIYRNEPFYSDDLLREVLSLLRQDGSVMKASDIHVLDMLFSNDNAENSVYDHCIDVALTANVLSEWLNFPESDRLTATACGLFHDVGKLMLPAGVPKRSGKLTPEEFSIIKTHTVEGFHLLSKYRNISDPVKDAALMHHERCDASGYPYGLKNDEISKFAKIIMIADGFDAMMRDKIQRSAMCPLSLIKYFEDEGLLKYEQKYLLTFLEKVSNAYLDHKITLRSGMGGNVIFISHEAPSSPVIREGSDETIDPQKEHYNNILRLSHIKNLSIETII